ncbi:antibiotic biosynthesis monooxygenase family protein [Nocardia brasiliensis]|uniref:antibiotic biosynthesis monooxygenase family protein n=1 Tax=Nocardia brasiliensis TaxID=37326 RepID=UPI00030329E5|nr:antibiotic biosynthesis monooxygenase [Nocardia brasiliensis]OCF84208.1 antibiotic biosynthesis monooxygenase [Nocardia brasiliensis]
MTGHVRVLVYLTITEADAAAVTDAYHRISTELAGTPGLLGNELLRGAGDSGAVLSEWESFAAFRTWEHGMAHRGATSPLRPYQDASRGKVFEVFEVAAAHRAPGAE